MKKERVDVLAVQQGLFETREQAKRGVMAGLVYKEKNNERLDKPGEKIAADTLLQIKGKKLPYVSRGGLLMRRCKMAPKKAMHWMSVTISWHGSCGKMSE